MTGPLPSESELIALSGSSRKRSVSTMSTVSDLSSLLATDATMIREDCKKTVAGTEYNGREAKTENGATCLKWSTQVSE